MKRILFLSMMLLLCSSIVYADNNVFTCLDTSVSQRNITIYNATDNTILIATSENITCGIECNTGTGRCYETSVADFGVIFGLSILIYFFLLLSFNTKESIWFLNIFYLGIAIWLMYLDISMIQRVGELANSFTGDMIVGAVTSILWFAIFMSFYLLMSLFVRSVDMLKSYIKNLEKR